ncbi:Juxtaposed with another zinc finger protein 1 [Anabarilius grahami]|uniref:Juxtaposed with another zinc finger protein 1 n=1 Tax=Anabarilius grahami TaxID=495550 RepID=A0A3N0XJ85_ANAGA|nr:Juxtaposed with another zinc finger protein 1 [Anabarilius grahami]
MTCVGGPSSLSCCVARSRPALLQLLPLSACLRLCASACDPLSARPVLLLFNVAKTMTGIAAASFFSNICQFGGCGLHFESLAELIVHIEDNHIVMRQLVSHETPPSPTALLLASLLVVFLWCVCLYPCQSSELFISLFRLDTDPRVLEKQELQQPTYVALSYINRFMTDAARREHESLKKKVQPKLSLSLTGSLSRNSVATPPRHNSGNLTPPVTPPITPSSSFRSSTPTGSEYDEEEAEYEESDSDESWTTESAISSESILSSMCMNGGDEKPFACPVPGCKKRYKNVNGIKYHAKNGHRTQIRVRKPFKCRCGKSYKSSQGLRHHTINFHPPVSADIIRKMQQ